jgi:hypothetical protein
MSEVSLMSIGQWHETYGKASRASVEGMITQFDKVCIYTNQHIKLFIYLCIYKYYICITCIHIYLYTSF